MTADKPLGERVARIEEWVEGVAEDVQMLKQWKNTASQDITILNQKVGVGGEALNRAINFAQLVLQAVVIYYITRG